MFFYFGIISKYFSPVFISNVVLQLVLKFSVVSHTCHNTLINVKARTHDPILRIQFLVPKIGSRRLDGPISRFRFCGENVGRSFVVCSHDPIFITNKRSSIWRQNDHSDIMQICRRLSSFKKSVG